MNASKTLALLAILAALTGGAHAADADFSLTPAIDHTSGRYGTDSVTSVTSTSVTGKYETDDWSFKLSVPYLLVRGGGAVPGTGGAVNNNPTQRRQGDVVSGLGDIVASATYTAYSNESTDFDVDLTGKIKFATANRDKGLGTGANDYTARVDLSKGYSALTLFGGLSYTVLGNTPYLELHNVYGANVGASFAIGKATSLGLSYDGQQASSPTAGPVSEATLFFSRKIADNWRSRFYVMRGFAAGSPDWGVGLAASYYF